jgi:hypothetical protein
MELLAWPGVALVLGLVAIFTFRKSLERLIDRTQKVGRAGIEAGQAIQQAGEQKPVSTADELLKDFDNALLVKREAEIRTMLDGAKLPSGGDRERVLIRYLAGASLTMTFETVYARIWGSQISALQFLNEAGANGVDSDLLKPWFEQAAAREPQAYAGDTLERWLGFLESFSLIAKSGSVVVITLEGREFLKYVIHQGYTLYKRG